MVDRPLAPLDAIGGGKEAAARKKGPDSKDKIETAELQKAREHGLALLTKRMGPVGALIGSEDTALTIAFVILLLCFAVLGIAGLASIWAPATLSVVSSDCFKVILAVAGYIFGKLQTREK